MMIDDFIDRNNYCKNHVVDPIMIPTPIMFIKVIYLSISIYQNDGGDKIN